MITKELNGGRIIVARTEMNYDHKKGVITSVSPLEGPGTYKEVMGNITQERLIRPTTAQTFSLVDFALKNPSNEQCKDIISKFKNGYFWTSTENLCGENIIVYDNIDGKMPSDRKSLLKRFKGGDNSIRVVNYGFKTESQSISDFVKNPYVIAQVGDKDFVEDVVARVAEKISKVKPAVFALGKQTNDVKRYSALYSNWGDAGLNLDGGYGDNNVNGYASGVLKNAEGVAKNK